MSDFFSKIAEAAPQRISRDWMVEGSHVIKVENLSSMTSQLGKEIAIIEATVIDSDSMKRGTPVKDMVSLSGEQAWRLEANMRYLRSVIEASLPAELRGKINAETIQKAFSTEGSPSTLVGSVVRVRVISKESKNGKSYIEKSWIQLSPAEQEGYLAAEAEVSLSIPQEESSSTPAVEPDAPVTSSLDSDEDPEF